MDDQLTGQASTGVAGLDDVLNGGLTKGRLFLLEGHPGTGKTTIGLQFLLAGREAGELEAPTKNWPASCRPPFGLFRHPPAAP